MASKRSPPAELPNVPVPAIGIVILIVAVGLGSAYLVADRAMRRIDVLAALRER